MTGRDQENVSARKGFRNFFFYVRKDDIYLGHRVCQALEAAQWIRFTSAAPDLTIYAGDLNTEPSDVPFLLLRDRSGLSDCWVGGGEGEGHTCNTSYNSYSDNTGRNKRNSLASNPASHRFAQEVRGLTTSSTKLAARLD